VAEVELKFDLAPKAHAAFRRLPPLAGTRARTVRIVSTYFDTPDFELRRREMALRLRRAGRRWIQTLKAGRSGAGGLHSRKEWEAERPGPTLDLAALAGTALEGSGELGARLVEAFTVGMRRTTWTVEVSPGNRVEVALDRGEVRHGEAAEPISEVEIESVAGDPLAVFEFAERLMRAYPGEAAVLVPSAITKAQRGYRLARAEPAGPVRAAPAELDGTMAPALAARAIAAAALEQLLANQPGVLAGTDPEYLHQFRVALRRMRSCMGVFRAALGSEAAGLRSELRWIGQLAGPARDWDVFATATLPVLLRAYGDARVARSMRMRASIRRRAANGALRTALASTRWTRLQLAVAHWLAKPASAPDEGAESLPQFALRIVRKRYKRLLADARRLSALTPGERHALRLDAKKLRYALDGLAPIFRRKGVARWLDALSELQDDLGGANDAAVAARLLTEISPPAGFAQFSRGWFAAQEHASAAGVERHARGLEAVPKLKLRAEARTSQEDAALRPRP